MKIFKTIFAVAFAALTISCSNIVDDDYPVRVPLAPGQAYISVSIANQDDSARTLLPKIDITNLVLKGGLAGTEQTVLASADSYDEMKDKQIAVQTGDWNFTLTATVSGVAFSSGTVTKTIASGSENPLSFTLEPEDTTETKGTLDFSLTFTGTEGIDYEVQVCIDGGAGYAQGYKSGDTIRCIEHLLPGTYDIKIYFSAKKATINSSSEYDNSNCINVYKNYFRIEKGITTKATVENYNLNDIYSIDYDGYQKGTDELSTGQMTLKFCRLDGSLSGGSRYIELPKITNSNMTFSGWYTSDDFADTSRVTEYGTAPNKVQKIIISNENLKDLTLYAKWLVNSTGKVYTPMDFNFSIAASGLWSEKGKANTVTITPTVTRNDGATPTPLTCGSNGKLTLEDGTAVSKGEFVTFTAKLYDENMFAADITSDGFTFSIPAQNFSENYTLKITATYLGLAHDASFTYRVTDGTASVPAGTFNSSTGISGSGVFISGRTSVANMKALIASDHEVTQGEFEKYCRYGIKRPREEEGLGENYAVYNINWYHTLVYCNARSIAEGLTPCYTIDGKTSGWGTVPEYDNNETWDAVVCDFDANGWRLPTSAEWEYLARGGNLTNTNQSTYSGNNDIEKVAWYENNSGDKVHKVCEKEPNSLRLYDMTGNVQEFCWDWYNTSITSSTGAEGPSPNTRKARVYRGGSYNNDDDSCKISNLEGWLKPYNHETVIGFRVVRNAQ